MKALLRPLLLLPVLLLPACAWLFPPPPPAVPVVAPEPPRDIVGELRAAAAASGSTVEIVPVESPAIELLLQASLREQARGNFGPAQNRIEEALQVEPDNPRVLQELAELKLRQKRFEQAAELARRSFAGSAQLGELCVRNWLTLAEADRAAGRDPAVARARAAACAIRPLPRF